jgi:hypothetical protein
MGGDYPKTIILARIGAWIGNSEVLTVVTARLLSPGL